MHGVRTQHGEDELLEAVQLVLPLRQRRPHQILEDEGGLRHGPDGRGLGRRAGADEPEQHELLRDEDAVGLQQAGLPGRRAEPLPVGRRHPELPGLHGQQEQPLHQPRDGFQEPDPAAVEDLALLQHAPRPRGVGRGDPVHVARVADAQVRQDVPVEDGALLLGPDRIRELARRPGGPGDLQPPARAEPQREVPLHHETVLFQFPQHTHHDSIIYHYHLIDKVRISCQVFDDDDKWTKYEITFRIWFF